MRDCVRMFVRMLVCVFVATERMCLWCDHYCVDRKVIKSVCAVLAAKEEEEKFDRWSTGVTFGFDSLSISAMGEELCTRCE